MVNIWSFPTLEKERKFRKNGRRSRAAHNRSYTEINKIKGGRHKVNTKWITVWVNGVIKYQLIRGKLLLAAHIMVKFIYWNVWSTQAKYLQKNSVVMFFMISQCQLVSSSHSLNGVWCFSFSLYQNGTVQCEAISCPPPQCPAGTAPAYVKGACCKECQRELEYP